MGRRSPLPTPGPRPVRAARSRVLRPPVGATARTWLRARVRWAGSEVSLPGRPSARVRVRLRARGAVRVPARASGWAAGRASGGAPGRSRVGRGVGRPVADPLSRCCRCRRCRRPGRAAGPSLPERPLPARPMPAAGPSERAAGPVRTRPRGCATGRRRRPARPVAATRAGGRSGRLDRLLDRRPDGRRSVRERRPGWWRSGGERDARSGVEPHPARGALECAAKVVDGRPPGPARRGGATVRRVPCTGGRRGGAGGEGPGAGRGRAGGTALAGRGVSRRWGCRRGVRRGGGPARTPGCGRPGRQGEAGRARLRAGGPGGSGRSPVGPVRSDAAPAGR